jgi:hypothetical protein
MASALKSANLVAPEVLGGEGSIYAQKFARAQEAEDKLMNLLEQRSTNRISMPYLALAGEMLDPGRTGSFGEALGRGAKAYAGAQLAEEKDLRENALLEMQLAQMGAGQALKREALADLSREMAPGVPAPAAPEGAPIEGELPAAPVVSQMSGPLQGKPLTPRVISRMKMVDKDYGDALETEFKLQLDQRRVEQDQFAAGQGYVLDKATGKVKPIPGAEMRKEFVPEIGGDIMMSMEDAMALREFRNKGDVKNAYAIIDKYGKGVGPRPKVEPPVGGAPDELTGGPKTLSQREVSAAREKEVATTLAKDQADRTSKFLDNADNLRLSRAAAAENLAILQRNPKIAGYLNKPGVGNAMWQVIQDSLQAHSASGAPGVQVDIKRTDLESALQKVDPDFKISDFTDLSVLASNLARLELGMRKQIYAGSGMGSVSNLEGQPIKDIIGNRYDTPQALQKKMKLAGRAFDFDMDVAESFRKWNKSQGDNKTLNDYYSTPEYTRLVNGFEQWLSKNLGIPFRKRGGEPAVSNKNTILDEIRKRRGDKP